MAKCGRAAKSKPSSSPPGRHTAVHDGSGSFVPMLVSRVRHVARDLVARAIAVPFGAYSATGGLDAVASPLDRHVHLVRQDPRVESKASPWGFDRSTSSSTPNPSASNDYTNVIGMQTTHSAPRDGRRRTTPPQWTHTPSKTRGLTVGELRRELGFAAFTNREMTESYGGVDGTDHDEWEDANLRAMIRAIAVEDGVGVGVVPSASSAETSCNLSLDDLAHRAGWVSPFVVDLTQQELNTPDTLQAASVKLKRVKKMNKHKHRKRRKRDRNKTK